MRVVINWTPDGGAEIVTDGPCEVYSVCEHTPNDRVYRLGSAHTVSADAVDALLRDDPIGHAGDDRHAAVRNRILSGMVGEPHLRPVK